MSRRIGRWVYNSDSTLYGEAGWNLTGSAGDGGRPIVIDYTPGWGCDDYHAPGERCGGYVLYNWPGEDDGEPVGRYMRDAMTEVEQRWDQSIFAAVESVFATANAN